MAGASSKLETTLLFSLCTANVDVCQTATSCIGLVLGEYSVFTYSEPTKTLSSLLRNRGAYQELSSPAFRFTGLVAFQKRMRSLLRQMQYPTVGILNAWETAFDRWIHLAKEVSTSPIHAIDDKMFAEWRNFSGFLASLGGICTAHHGTALEEPAPSSLRWIDRLCSDNYEEPLLTRYLRLSIQLLGCSNVKVREAMRDVLSSEVSPILYHPLFRALESELEVLLTGALAPADKGQDSEIIFAEQAASLLKTMVERLASPSDLGAASSVHLGVLTLSFAKFIDAAPDGANTLRVKIRVCNLCEAVIKRKEHLNLRDDVRIRNQLVEYIFGWMARPHPVKQDQQSATGPRQDDCRRIQKDLDKACLKSLADLTVRLPLQPADSQTDAGTSELKSQMFHTYFNRFLSLLNHETQEMGRAEFPPGLAARDDVIPNSDLVITILSNLLSANIDVGLKHSLNIGYHENIDIRAAFVKVLYNILIQGTEFSSLTDSAVSEKYEELLNLLTTDLSLPVSMSAICPASEVDELTVCLLTIFEQRGLLFELFEALIQHEIGQTENETEILRRTCVATKMLSVYAKWKGVSYLRATLQKVLERLMLTSQDLDLELDPARTGSPEELQKNAMQLQIVAKVFTDDICASSSHVPASFRKICNIISEAVSPRFPNAKYTAVGAFVFLRFICPAIVAPESEGLLSTAPTKEMRRGLLLIAKIIQNLANNVLFGTKEPYMFPLNPFLVQNIKLVTEFLREISVPPERWECRANTGLLDFGSCVSLHRFLYDHWDHLRQTLVARERRGYVRSPTELARGTPAILEPLRNLITNLGPPPLAMSWNRPHISSNSPPLYSRFQNFMLRNAFKGTESFLTSRAVYDGGESKDGLSIVCVILRHIENENIDFDTLLYCYLKIASRLWHEPFGLFIDATCYNGRTEPPDEFFTTLDLLTPSELSLNLSRIYIYNMNSAFKRCFRRLLRVSARNENSAFHPKNVDYHLIGSLQDLQAHFHLSQLHLPKETISVVTDTRYMFQPVTRLSKSKGKVEVVIKVGSQFVQVTTAKKQEVLSGFRLSSTINDIFRLGEVEEAATTIQTEDESAFGLRADSGKIVMCFTSPKRADVLQTIRGAKGKYGKDSRAHKPLERLVRPQDVPGTMLNLALTNLASPDHALRLASYNLLGALCRAFEFGAASKLVCAKDLSVPLEPTRFIVNISKELAQTEPQLTSDFLTEFFVSWESFPEEQKPLSLEYMAPWLSGLRTSVLTNDADGEKGREKVASLFRKLIDLAVLDQSLTHALEHHVWPSVAQDELLLEIFLDELIKVSLGYGTQAESLEIISSVMVGLGTISLRGKMFSRLRKALNRSSLRPTRLLPDNAVWAEICVLLQFCLALSFDSGMQSQMFLPEVFHVVSMLANTGGQDVRLLVYKLLVNTIHAACVSFILDDAKLLKLRASLDLLCEPRGDIFSPPSTLVRDGASVSTAQDSGSTLAATENLAAILFEVCSIAAPSTDVANAWRSRWMSLVASTAFQNNPAVQPRAFAVMGYLAREEVDDDLLYQVLVALRNSISQFGEDGNSEMLVSIITSLSKMMAKLPSASRYGLQLFWLAMSLVRLVPSGLFNCTAHFLEAILTNIGTIGNVRGERMVPLLLQSRAQLEEAALPLDEAYGIHFDDETFHFAVCACVVRGLTDTVTRLTAIRVLSSFLEMTTWKAGSSPDGPTHAVHGSPYLALILARCMGHEDFMDTLWWADIKPDGIASIVDSRGDHDIGGVRDRDLVLISAIELVDFHYLEDAAQARSLHWLNKLALERPGVFVRLCGAMPSILDDVLLHGQESAALEAAHSLLRTLTSDRKYSAAMGSMQPLAEVLDELGFSGLWRYASQSSMEEVKQECFELTEKLIELIVV
ncbi:Pentafunctional AROM polypeptide [Tolypocladium capitatum]|uniref:Pentafunctional AROM polypeptide n=1 Tax=Tolypocladium capitatum TaxID=45235 RepID=A0A2K3QPJ7_9HYPO|nr:Pentafunctional AROM polypeptide [Tolypocladium capitatum]